MPRTLLCLARHGETNWNLERRFQGQLDIALNARGRAQAKALARELEGAHFDCVYSSDLKRALSTATPLASSRGLVVKKSAELREKHDGVWQGFSHPEVETLFPQGYAKYKARRADYAAEGGESLETFAARVSAALTTIAERHAGETALVVAHAGVLDIAWRLAVGKRLDETRQEPVLNAAPNWFAFEDGRWSLVEWASAEGREPVAAPWEATEPARREAARLLILNERDEILLMRCSSRLAPHLLELGHGHFWATPGGALQDGESFEDAARRELFEETGLADVEIGPVVAEREYPMQLGDDWVQAVERFYTVRVDDLAPSTQGFTEEEKTHTLGFHWWRAEDIAGTDELIFPEALDALIDTLPRRVSRKGNDDGREDRRRRAFAPARLAS